MFIYQLTTRCATVDDFIDQDDGYTFKEKLAALIQFYGLKVDKIIKWKRTVYR